MLCDIQSLVMIIEMMMMMMMTGWVVEEGVEEGEAEAVSIHFKYTYCGCHNFNNKLM